MARHSRRVETTIVLDCEGFSRYLAGDLEVVGIADRARDCVISVATILEATRDKVDRGRHSYVLSQMHIEPLTVDLAKEASDLLVDKGLHGHKYALDAMVAVTALRQAGPVILLTSDVDDMRKLCGRRVEVVGL